MNTIMDSSTLYNYLSSIHDQIKSFTVTEEFIQYRNKMKDKFRANGREDYKRLMHADCLAVEYLLLQKGLVEEPESIFHDFVYEGAKVDCKLITSKYFNVPDDKVLYYMENLRKGRLTDFAFYKYRANPDGPLKMGDTVQFVLKEVTPADHVMKHLRPSQYPGQGYYYVIK